MEQSDKDYAAAVVAKQTGLPLTDASQKVTDWVSRAESEVADLVAKGRDGLIAGCHALLASVGLQVIKPLEVEAVAAAGEAIDAAVPVAAPIVAAAETALDAAIASQGTAPPAPAPAPAPAPVAPPAAPASPVEAAPASAAG